MASLHIFFTRALPEFEEEQRRDVLLVADEDDGEDAKIAADELEYATTLVTTYDNLESLAYHVNQWWLDWAGAAVSLQLITDDPLRMAPNELERLAALRESARNEAWSINTAFVAFRPESRQAKAEAIQFLIRTSTVAQ